MPKSIVITKENFESLQHALIFVNTTAKTQVQDPKQIEIVEYSKARICLRLPASSCAEGHAVMLFVAPEAQRDNLLQFVKTHQGKGVMSITGKIKSVEPNKNETSIVWVDLIQYIEGEWREFLKAYTDKQNQIDKIIKDVKR